MENDTHYLLPLTEEESVKLLHEATAMPGRHIDLAFGPGGVALRWEKDTPMPWSVEYLGLLRGVLNENCDGAGI